ncbi:uncharacterized protein LOC134827652 isoform X2 [Culicoides brevitarsis]|uniref:uncharacterized protein LOC134827652 isoform X2 n=1 Tax=Culicoides brevitarsis TaxID=469753 RepID=UPI00307BEBC7
MSLDKSPEESTSCVKCDILLCQELGITSPHAELQQVNLEQREAVKRNLAFDDLFRDQQQDSDSQASLTTLSGSLSPCDLALPDSSFSSLESYHTAENHDEDRQNESIAKKDPESTDECSEKDDLYCDEVMPESPPPQPVKVAFLKRCRSGGVSRLGPASSILGSSKKKKRVDF